jgi:hypothetical protein
MTGIKMLDALARMPGMKGQDRDAKKAYTQANLDGPPTWIFLPKDQQPPEWKGKYRRPVVWPRLALYGHPFAGLYWEQHAHKAIKECGFLPVPDWECMFYQPYLQLTLGVYVADFKLAGKEENLSKGWEML